MLSGSASGECDKSGEVPVQSSTCEATFCPLVHFALVSGTTSHRSEYSLSQEHFLVAYTQDSVQLMITTALNRIVVNGIYVLVLLIDPTNKFRPNVPGSMYMRPVTIGGLCKYKPLPSSH